MSSCFELGHTILYYKLHSPKKTHYNIFQQKSKKRDPKTISKPKTRCGIQNVTKSIDKLRQEGVQKAFDIKKIIKQLQGPTKPKNEEYIMENYKNN